MAKFRKRPVVVEATPWFENGDHPEDRVGETAFDPISDKPYTRLEGQVVRFYRDPVVNGRSNCCICHKKFHVHGWIDTLEGGHIVCPGDYVITGVKGERYPCKPDIFEATYEAVDDG